MQPNFAYQPGSNELTLRASQEALALTRRGKVVSAATAARWKGPEEVRREARDRVAQRGGDPTDDLQVLAESELQLGQYRGQTFRWLLENDVGYAFVRQTAPTAKASRLGDLRKYVLARDAAKAALVAAGKAARAAAQPPLDAAVWPEDGPSDADLLAAAAEVDSCRDAPPAVAPPLSLSQPPERPLQDTTCGERCPAPLHTATRHIPPLFPEPLFSVGAI
ncbi:unnamed protein product [Merluccius merluccius]